MANQPPPLAERRKPGLSATLPYERHPEICQSCGKRDRAWNRWEECDEFDRRSGIIVILCPACSRPLVEPHPRLYHLLEPGVPRPGVMALCGECEYHETLRCGHPDLKANGGPGLAISQPRNIGVVCGGGCRPLYDGIPRTCAGRTIGGVPAPDLYGAVPSEEAKA